MHAKYGKLRQFTAIAQSRRDIFFCLIRTETRSCNKYLPHFRPVLKKIFAVEKPIFEVTLWMQILTESDEPCILLLFSKTSEMFKVFFRKFNNVKPGSKTTMHMQNFIRVKALNRYIIFCTCIDVRLNRMLCYFCNYKPVLTFLTCI